MEKNKKDFTLKVLESYIHDGNYNWVIYQFEDNSYWLDMDQYDDDSILIELEFSQAMKFIFSC